MKILTARHGLTAWNAEGKVCGATDIPLAEEGLRQAEALAEKLRGAPIDVIIASPLVRAQQTAACVAKATGLPVATDARLVERNFGSYEGTPYDSAEFQRLRNQFAYVMPGGESMFQVAQRLYNLVDELRRTHAGKTVLLVAHGCVCRVLHSYFTSMEDETFRALSTDNCEVREYEIDPL